jgi:hypothetical protein
LVEGVECLYGRKGKGNGNIDVDVDVDVDMEKKNVSSRNMDN